MPNAFRMISCAALLSLPCVGPAVQASCALQDAPLLPVLELYTSEGCSSCPPAERWLATELDRGLARISVPLALHVDYWDRLGWPDPFADPRHAARQRARVSAAGGRVVYTPQFMLGEQVQLRTRSGTDLREAILGLSGSAPGLRGQLQATGDADGVEVGLELSLEDDASAVQAWLLLISNGLSRRIGAGENHGSVLRHERVVQHWQGPWQLSPEMPLRGRTRLPWPALRGSSEGVVLLIARDDDAPAWALQLDLEGC